MLLEVTVALGFQGNLLEGGKEKFSILVFDV